MPFEAHLNRWRVAQLFAIAAAFVLIGVWLAGGFGPVGPIRGWSPSALHVFGWIAIVFFGLALAIIAPRVFQSGVEVRVDAEGFYGRRYSKRVVPWSAIERIQTVDGGRIQYAYLYLRDPADYQPSGVSGWIERLRASSSGRIAVTLQGTDGNLADMRAAFDYFAPGRREDPAA